jgi:hypothetical protein
MKTMKKNQNLLENANARYVDPLSLKDSPSVGSG